MSDEYFKSRCHFCDGPIEFPGESAGSTVECQHCGKRIIVRKIPEWIVHTIHVCNGMMDWKKDKWAAWGFLLSIFCPPVGIWFGLYFLRHSEKRDEGRIMMALSLVIMGVFLAFRLGS